MSAPTDPRPDALVGHLIEGRYRVLAPLGRGGMGVVYRVEHVALKRELALKLLLPELVHSDELTRRFEREASACARLSHPNIVAVTDFGRTADGQLFMVMELLDGPSLGTVLSSGRPLGVDRALHIQRQILRALGHAHEAGIVHRDLKPDNVVLVTRDGVADVVKLLDFGIAKLSMPDDAEEAMALTMAGVIYGTPAYLSPEQAVGEPIDRRTDLYAAGIILYEMLVGHRPFVSTSAIELVSMQITKKAVPIVEAAPSVPGSLSGVVDRALEKRREARWQDAATFLAALDGEGTVVHGRTITLTGRVRRVLRGAIVGLSRRLAARGVPAPRLVAYGVWIAIALVVLGGVGLVAHRTQAPVASTPVEASADRSRAEKTIHDAHTCKERRAAALQLIAAGDRRYLGALEAARDRRGGFLGLEKINACMLHDLEPAIRKLRGAH